MTLLPAAALAAEGDNVHLTFAGSDRNWLWASLGLGVVAILFGIWLRSNILKLSPGSENMQAVGKAIKDGALAYLRQQVRTMAVFVVVLAVGLYVLYKNAGGSVPFLIPLSFLMGVTASYLAGYAGMITAVDGNMRTANAALKSYKLSLETAFRSGAVAGMFTVGLGLIGASVILLFAGDAAMKLLIGFGFGGSLAALFMRVGGGIFTKAADVGADLVGKVEAGIPEDDPRNPATIADNVGDNVGDCAGMAADIFESYEVTLVAALVLGAATSAIFDTATWTRLVVFAIAARGVGIVASIIGVSMVKGTDDVDADPLGRIRKGFWTSAVIAAAFTTILAFMLMGGDGKNLIRTNQFTAVQTKQEQLRKSVQSFASELKVKRPSVTDQEIVDEFGKSEQGKDFADKAQQPVIISFLTAKEEVPGAIAASDGWRAIDFNAKDDPVLDFTTLDGRMIRDPGDTKDGYITVRDAFKDGKLKVFQVEVTPKAPTDPKQPPTPPQKIWVGPTTDAYLQEVIDKNKSTGVSIVKKQTCAITLFEKDRKVALGVADAQGWIDLVQLTRSFQIVEDPIKKLRDNKQNPTPPTMVQTTIGTVDSKTVPWYSFAVAIIFGIVMAFLIELLTDYYVSTHKKPTQEVAGVATAGPAPMIIQGFAYACESSVFMVFAIVFALIVPLYLFNPALFGGYTLSFYGIALVGLGLLTTTGYVLAMDTFGPISDNAQGVYEMSGDGHDNEYGSKAVQRLDAAGNTTKALTKGFAIATAVVAAVALFHSYLESAQLQTIGLRLDIPEIFLGLLIGAAAPFLFSAFAINAVGRAAFELINEVRRQFRADKGIMAGTSRPDYGRCVAIVTKAAQRELIGPAVLAVALPTAVAFGFSIGKTPTVINGHLFNLTGAQALGGFLAGSIASGQLLAVLLANSGGMWDNAKKLIEDGLHGGKGTEAHKAGVVCDTVGDPFKDTAGPALNPLIKVMNLVALLLAEKVILPLENGTLVIITLVSVGALAFTIYVSKKGSMSSAMSEAQSSPSVVGSGDAIEAGGTELPKKTLTVEELTEGDKDA